MKEEATEAARSAARRFIDATRPVDSVGVQAFSEEFRILHAVSSDETALRASLDGLQPAKDTALYDGLIESLNGFGGRRGHGREEVSSSCRTVDTLASAATLDDALAVARIAGVRIYAIGLKTAEFDSTPLTKLAEASGGRYLETPDPDALADLFAGIAKEIHNQYLLIVELPEEHGDGRAGQLTVGLTAGGTPGERGKGFLLS